MDYETFTIPGDEAALSTSEFAQCAAFGRPVTGMVMRGQFPPRRSAVMTCRVPACSFTPAVESAFCSTHRVLAIHDKTRSFPGPSVPCPDCLGRGAVWADFDGAEVEAECPYCGGSGTALVRALERDGKMPRG